MQKAINDLRELNIIDEDILAWAFKDSDSPEYKNWEVLQDPVRDIINLQKLRNYEQRQHSYKNR